MTTSPDSACITCPQLCMADHITGTCLPATNLPACPPNPGSFPEGTTSGPTCDDALRVAGPVLVDVINGLLYVLHELQGHLVGPVLVPF